MFKSGDFVAEHLTPHDDSELDEEQIQPNGVDLTVDKILTHSDPGRGVVNHGFMGDDEYVKPQREEVTKVDTRTLPPQAQSAIESEEAYVLQPGGHVVVYNEEILEIPEEHVGFVWPRSRFLRVAAHLTSAVWDTGYSGRGEGALLTTQPLYLETDMAVGQMTFARADNYQSYDGSHQGERKE